MKINFNKFTKLKKISSTFILILIFVSFIYNLNIGKVYAVNQEKLDQSFQSINSLSDSRTGLLTCDPNAAQDSSSSCTPKSAILLGVKLAQVLIYIIIIALILFLIIGGIGYVYNGKNPGYLNKWKKHIKNAVYALLIIVFGMVLVFGLLSAFRFKSDVLNFIKNLFANLNFQIIQHSYAQSLSSLAEKSTNGEYTNFFPGQTITSIILTSIKFFINYIAAPALIFATIWSGVRFVAAQGNTDKLVKAKKFAFRVVIGIIVAAAAYSASSIFLNTINGVAKESSSVKIINKSIGNLNINNFRFF